MMEDVSSQKKFKKAEIIGIIVVCLLAPLFHFIYEFSGFSPFVGTISAVNESVWEHSKIMYFPFLFYSIIEYIIVKPDFKRFWAAKAVSLAFLPLVMITFFYTYTGIFGAENVVIDIICTMVWIFLAFVISYKLYNSDKDLEKYFGWFVLLFFAVFAMEMLFTAFPIQIPLFQDSITGSYGFPA